MSNTSFQNASFQSEGLLDNRYRLERVVGKGNMGDVWKAYDEELKRDVALKFIPSDIQQFRNEMRRVKEAYKMAKMLDHPSICPVYEMPYSDSVGYYLVMKWLPGEPLDRYIDRQGGKLTHAQAMDILRPLAVALDYAHGLKVIHRDIRPSCISIDADANGKVQNATLINFALAAEIWECSTRLSQSQVSVSGIPSYMPPEQWQCRRQNAQTDQYSLGVVAYEILSGRLPFYGANIDMLRQTVLKDLPEIIPDLPRYTNQALRRAMAKKSNKRFPTCSAFVHALETPPKFFGLFG